MARVKLSEYDAKRLLFPASPVFPASGSSSAGAITRHFGNIPLVVKVDQGIKKRGKQGLVKVGVDAKGAVSAIRAWSDSWSRFLIEPLVEHVPAEESFLSLTRTREGWLALTSPKGGIDIESHWDEVRSVDPARYRGLITDLEKYHIVTAEFNPLLVRGSEFIALDAACEIDDAALGLAGMSSLGIVPVTPQAQAASEIAVAALDSSTPASLKFRLLNPDGSIWMLLSGGGASLVLADEVADLELGAELANYGEYSGAPSTDDTFAYTKIILKQILINESSPRKALIIAGGVANFTDVAATFKGIIAALGVVKAKLAKSGVRVFVRRGGPNEKKGLSMMAEFLEKAGLLGSVYGHEIPLTQVVADAAGYLKQGGSE